MPVGILKYYNGTEWLPAAQTERIKVASKEEAIAGVENTVFMTPLRSLELIQDRLKSYSTTSSIQSTLNSYATVSSVQSTYLPLADAWKNVDKKINGETDLNLVITPGLYDSDSDGNTNTLLNKPSGVSSGFFMNVHELYPGRIIQELISRSNLSRYSRSRSESGDWTSWVRVYDENYKPTAANVGALPLAGGTMTGALNLGTQQIKANIGSYTGNLLATYAGDANGCGLAIGGGGLTVIGGGEAAGTYISSKPDGGNATTENLALTADNIIVLRSGVQAGFADTKKITMDANGRLNLNVGGMTFPTTGGQWISGKTTNNVINCTVNSSGSYHPIMRYTMNSGNVGNLGVLGDRFGFWGFLSTQTANGTNAGAYLDVANNRWTSDGGLQAGNSNGNIKRTTISASAASGGVNGDVWFKV